MDSVEVVARLDFHRVHGPVVVPCSGELHHPGLYARYQIVDLDANNKHAVDAAMEANPDMKRPYLGYCVCRHGFGQQVFADRRPMSRELAARRAVALNRSMPIGVAEDLLSVRERVAAAGAIV